MGSTSKLKDKDWLYEQYVVNKKSLRTIAGEIGVTTAAVSRYAKMYRLPLRNRGESRALTLKQLNPNAPSTTYKKIHPLLQDRDWLYQKYVVEGLAMRQIVELIGLSNRRLLKRALKQHGIHVRSLREARHNRTVRGRTKKTPNPIITQNKEYIISSYINGESIRSIRHRFSISRNAVYKVLLEAGVTLRTSGEANIGRKHSPEALMKMSRTASDQIMCGIRSSNDSGRRVNCLTPNNGFVTMRSTWEKKYAEYLRSNNINFMYEPKTFQLSNGKNYIVDFYLPDTDEYIEIKEFLSDNQDDQNEKYELFKQEYSHVKCKILYKEDLIDMGIDIKKEIPTVYLLIGAPGAGKSWVANQLKHKYKYISYDENPKKDHLTLLREPTDRPIIYDPTFKISTFIRRHSHEFDIKLIAIKESEDILKERIFSRGGEWTSTIAKRNLEIQKRFAKYGAGGFIGTSQEVLNYLDNMIK